MDDRVKALWPLLTWHIPTPHERQHCVPSLLERWQCIFKVWRCSLLWAIQSYFHYWGSNVDHVHAYRTCKLRKRIFLQNLVQVLCTRSPDFLRDADLDHRMSFWLKFYTRRNLPHILDMPPVWPWFPIMLNVLGFSSTIALPVPHDENHLVDHPPLYFTRQIAAELLQERGPNW